MLYSILRGDLSIGMVVMYILAVTTTVMLILPFHELAHGFIAYKLGDDTAKREGRLTLNPLYHIDYIGALCLLLVGFGWAKPVPVNMRRLNNPKRDMALVALAGPVANLELYVKQLEYERYLSFALIALIMLDVIDKIIGVPIALIDNWIFLMVGKAASLFF